MSDSTTTVDPNVRPAALDGAGAAAYLGGLSAHTLRNWRTRGVGPRYLRLGDRVVYRIADLDAYLDEVARGGGHHD